MNQCRTSWLAALAGLLVGWAGGCVPGETGLPAGGGPPLPGLTDGQTDNDQDPDVAGDEPDGTDDGNSDGTQGGDPCVDVGTPISATHHDMFEALNEYRLSQGRSELEYSKVLEEAADAHARDMYERGFFDHVNPDGDGPLERGEAAGFCRMHAIGENIAWNQRDVAEVQEAWENSPGHNANMLSTNYRYVGMGYYLSPVGPYWVQVFGNVFPE